MLAAMTVHFVPVERPRGSVGQGSKESRDPEITAGYLRDASGEVGQASALFRPESEADVAEILARAHRERIAVTVVAGQTPEVTETLAAVYGATTSGGIFRARDIKTAEAAKVIENAQRDINIAFINEVARIFHRLDISTHDVLDAAATKWNFLDFRPGLVGGRQLSGRGFFLG